ncbi:hypothetical protein TWF694_003142 [Orbilia ellipsospora]|uniref:Peptidase A1 domain-containing protein n=1 Tax=Orbilia ellipsospora TaxID=2528407 RepID=A0AAV9X352_9PEZI
MIPRRETFTRYGPWILVLLLSSFYLLQQHAESTLSSISPRQVRRAAPQEYVVLPVTFEWKVLGSFYGYIYVNVLFGIAKQPLKLLLFVAHITWVPLLPASVTEYCNKPENLKACQLAGNSGYYTPPEDAPRNDSFLLVFDIFSNVTGFWVEDLVTADDVGVNLEFGVAERFLDGIPRLGLGIWPNYEDPTRPSYVEALQQQGRTASQYCSWYDVSNPDASGSILIGGVDLDKFSGKLKVWRLNQLPGIVSTPTVEINMPSSSMLSFSSENEPNDLVLISPESSFIFLPPNTLQSVMKILSPNTLFIGFNIYTLPCSTQMDPTWTLDFVFDEVSISVPFSDLLSPLNPPPAYHQADQCILLVLPNDRLLYDVPGYNFSYILGAPFLRSAYVVVDSEHNVTALAPSNHNITTESIVLLGGDFGADIDTLVGNTPVTPTSSITTASANKTTPAMKAGIGAGCGAAFLLACGIGYLVYRRRPAPPSIPIVQPLELPVEEREPGELHWMSIPKDGDGESPLPTEQQHFMQEPPMELPATYHLYVR